MTSLSNSWSYVNWKRIKWWTPTDLGTWGGTSQSAQKPVRTHRAANKLKNSSQCSNKKWKEKRLGRLNPSKAKKAQTFVWKPKEGFYLEPKFLKENEIGSVVRMDEVDTNLDLRRHQADGKSLFYR
jgi:hypothetical protein